MADVAPARVVLSMGVLVFFMTVNLLGTRVSGRVEDLVVYTKVMLLAIFVGIGLTRVHTDNFLPVLDRAPVSVFVAAATIFVAFEGFQLITNAVVETRDPDRNVPRGIYGSILITSMLYITVAFVALGTQTVAQLVDAREYALALAGGPVLGAVGPVLVDFAAILATSSAINATSFGASRMMAEMATERRMPEAFSFRSHANVPWMAVVVLTGAAVVFASLGSLETIAAFSSLTFLLISAGVSVANYRLRDQTRSHRSVVVLGLALMLVTIVLLIDYMWLADRATLFWVLGLLAGIAVTEVLFFERSEWRATSLKPGSGPVSSDR
jgi:amino acid transporter